MVKNDADEEVFIEMEVYRVDAMVRMLCGLNAMGKWKADIDVENKKMRVKCNMEGEYGKNEWRTIQNKNGYP